MRPRGRTLPALAGPPDAGQALAAPGSGAGSSSAAYDGGANEKQMGPALSIARGCSSAGRAAALQAVGRGFESLHLHFLGVSEFAGRLGPRTVVGRNLAALRRLAPADPPQHMRAAASGPSALVVTFGLGDEVAPDRLPVAGRTPLHAATGMVDTAQRGPAVTALLRLVAVPGSEFLSPGDRSVRLPVDDDGVSQAADSLVISPPQCEQMAMTLLCSAVPPIISGPCDIGADTEKSVRSPVLRCANDSCDSEEPAAVR